LNAVKWQKETGTHCNQQHTGGIAARQQLAEKSATPPLLFQIAYWLNHGRHRARGDAGAFVPAASNDLSISKLCCRGCKSALTCNKYAIMSAQ